MKDELLEKEYINAFWLMNQQDDIKSTEEVEIRAKKYFHEKVNPTYEPVTTIEDMQASWRKIDYSDFFDLRRQGVETTKAMQKAIEETTRMYGPEPKRKSDGKPGVISIAVKAVKFIPKAISIIAFLKGIKGMKIGGFAITLTSFVTLLYTAVPVFITAYKLAVPEGITVNEWWTIIVATVGAIVGALKTTNSAAIK